MSDGEGLPKGWCWATVAQLADIQGGIQKQPKRTPKNNAFPYLRVANVYRNRLDLSAVHRIELFGDELSRLRLLAGDLLIVEGNGSKKEIGRSAIWNGAINNCVHQNHIIRVRFLAGDSRFYNSYWNSPVGNHRVMDVAASTSGLYTLSVSKVSRLPVPLAPENEQRRIAEKIEELFSDLDAGVAALERAKANLKRYRAAVLKAAVEGRLTEAWRADHFLRPPGEGRGEGIEPASQLLQRILAQRRRKWQQDQLAKYQKSGKKPPPNWKTKYKEPASPDTSNLPELPEGWCWATFGQVALFQNGRAFPSKEYTNQGVKLLRPGNLFADGSVRWTERNTRKMPHDWADQHPSYIVRGNELVMNLTAQSLADEFLGRTCVTDADECCLLNQRLARITPVGDLAPQYVLAVLKSRLFRVFVNGLNTGSLIQHMFTSQLHRYPFPLAPREEQGRITAIIEEVLVSEEQTDTLIHATLQRAARLRQSILKRAFEGKLVPQDPTDEPATKLLERIKTARPIPGRKGKRRNTQRRRR